MSAKQGKIFGLFGAFVMIMMLFIAVILTVDNPEK
jgi:hypothetical protein